MKTDAQAATILVAEDDEGHAVLIRDGFHEAGLTNEVLHFKDGQSILDFVFARGEGPRMETNKPYLLLVDIRMPKVDGVEVLRQIKADERLHKLPVIMLTTTGDPREVAHCHELGCSVYLQKPVQYDKFSEAIRKLGLFVTLVLIPRVADAS